MGSNHGGSKPVVGGLVGIAAVTFATIGVSFIEQPTIPCDSRINVCDVTLPYRSPDDFPEETPTAPPTARSFVRITTASIS